MLWGRELFFRHPPARRGSGSSRSRRDGSRPVGNQTRSAWGKHLHTRYPSKPCAALAGPRPSPDRGSELRTTADGPGRDGEPAPGQSRTRRPGRRAESPAAPPPPPPPPGQTRPGPALPPRTPSAPAAGGNGNARSPTPGRHHPHRSQGDARRHTPPPPPEAGAFPQGPARRPRVRRRLGSRAGPNHLR